MRVHRDHSNRLKHFARQLRRDMTDAERRLWTRLRQHQLAGFRFRRQHPIAGFILDFYCVSKRLGIELDGGQHVEPDGLQRDEARDAALAELGVKIVRFSNVDVLRDSEAVAEAIYRALTNEPPP